MVFLGHWRNYLTDGVLILEFLLATPSGCYYMRVQTDLLGELLDQKVSFFQSFWDFLKKITLLSSAKKNWPSGLKKLFFWVKWPKRTVFSKKNEKMTQEHFVFKRVDVFLTKYGHESYLFLENGRFWQNMDMRAGIFSWEIGKKGHPIDFFGP